MNGGPEASAAPLMSRRAWLLAAGAAIAGGGTVAFLDNDPAPPASPAAEGDTVVVNPPAAAAPATAQASLDPETRAANNEKTRAEADKLAAEADKLRTEAANVAAESAAKVAETRAATEREGIKNWGNTAAVALTILTAGATAIKWIVTRRDLVSQEKSKEASLERMRLQEEAALNAERLRQEAKAQEDRERASLEARDTKFHSALDTVLGGPSGTVPADSLERLKNRAAIELLTFAEVPEYRSRILATTTALLRQRQRPSRLAKPTPFDLHVARAFVQTALDERDTQFERTPVGLNAYPEVDAPVPDADVDVWNFESAHVALIDATNVVLDGVDLIGEDFGRFDFAGSSFRNCNANRTQWSGADLSEVNFFGAKLHGAYFGNTRLAGANFDSADLRGAVFHEIDFTYIDLLPAASLRGTRIVGTKGLTEDAITELRRRGAIVTDIGDYQSADDVTSPGDDPASSIE